LASLSDLTPNQLWLTTYSESGQDVKISGIAFTEDQIAQFMRDLEGSSEFAAVELLVSEQAESSGTKLKRFELAMKLESAVPKTADASANKK
jgi:type IV pilus assembly protein PilN